MTTAKSESVGQNYWNEYVQLNGDAFCPNSKGLVALSKKLGVGTYTHTLSRCIWMYLGA